MLMPKRVKYRKTFRGRMKGKAQRGNVVQFGEYGLQALEPAWITSRQIEAARRTIMRHIKRRGACGFAFSRQACDQALGESRMGKGKGAVDHYVAVVRPGLVLFEMAGTEKRWRASAAAGGLQAAHFGPHHQAHRPDLG